MSDSQGQDLAYFEKDVKFDKRFYVNNCKEILLIILALVIYYAVLTIVFWGHVSLGQNFAVESMWFYVAMFIFIVIWILIMVLVGHQQNKTYARHQFYLKKINDKQQAMREKEQREEQRRKQEARIAANQAAAASLASSGAFI